MRVCHIISGDLWAGAEVMVCRLLEGFRKYNNLELSAILLNEGKLLEELNKLGIPVEIVSETQNNIFQIVRKVRKIIKLYSPEIIHSHGFKENIIARFSKNSNKDILLVCTQHGMPEPLSKKRKIFKKMFLLKYQYHILKKYFKCIVVVSLDIKDFYIKKCNLSEDKVFLIHNGTRIPRNITVKKRGHIFVIGSAGRFFPIKNYTFMVEIAREIINQTNDIRFELAGEGPEKEKILDLIQAYNLRNVFTLTGFMEDMANFYQGLDLFINTSFHEGLPMSILEAMAHGLPVIALNTGGLKEILIDGSQGYLVDGHIPKVFAEKCLNLYKNSDLLLEMGKSSREKIKKDFSLDTMSERYNELYQKIL